MKYEHNFYYLTKFFQTVFVMQILESINLFECCINSEVSLIPFTSLNVNAI
jgi:hypothetical protein